MRLRRHLPTLRDASEFQGYRDALASLPSDIAGMQGRISSLAIAPIKSLGMLPLQVAEVSSRGLQVPGGVLVDRMAMLVERKPGVTKDGRSYDYRRFSQREEPALVVVEPYSDFETELIYQAPDIDPLRLALDALVERPRSRFREPVSVRMSMDDDLVLHGIIGDRNFSTPVTNWVRQFLRKNAVKPRYNIEDIHLLVPPIEFSRLVEEQHRRDLPGATTLYSDGGQVLTISQSTLDWMNAFLEAAGERQIDMRAFRPNIVLEGLPPNIEDIIDEVVIANIRGDIRMLFGAMCVRCPVTMVDQKTGSRPDGQPLKWLNKHRPPRPGTKEDTRTFGVNTVFERSLDLQEIAVGDLVTITGEKSFTPPEYS